MAFRTSAKDNSLAMIENIEQFIKWDFNRNRDMACTKFMFQQELKVAVHILHHGHGMEVDGSEPPLNIFDFENDSRFKYDCEAHVPMYARALFGFYSSKRAANKHIDNFFSTSDDWENEVDADE